MSELNQHKVARLQRVIHLLPAPLIEIGTTAATRHGSIDDINLLLIENRIGYGSPAPHAILIFISILNRAVTRDKNHRLTLLTLNVVHWKLNIPHHGFQRAQRRIMAGHQSLGS